MIFFLSLGIFYNSLKVVDYINSLEHPSQHIKDTKLCRATYSLVSTILLCIIFKYVGYSYALARYSIVFLYFFITSYIDYKSMYVYTFISRIWIVIGCIVLVLDLYAGIYDITQISLSVITVAVCLMFNKFIKFGSGDTEFMVVVVLFLGGFVGIVTLVLGISLSMFGHIKTAIINKRLSGNVIALTPYLSLGGYLVILLLIS